MNQCWQKNPAQEQKNYGYDFNEGNLGIFFALGVPRLRFTPARQALRCNLFFIPLPLHDKKGFPLQTFTQNRII